MEFNITDSEVKSIGKFLEPMRGPTDWMIQTGALLQLHADLKTMIRVDLTSASPAKYLHNQEAWTGLDSSNFLLSEPMDHRNIVKCYETFLQSVSIAACESLKKIQVTTSPPSQEQHAYKYHSDWLHYDLESKHFRYTLHDYCIRRLNKSLFINSGTASSADTRLQ